MKCTTWLIIVLLGGVMIGTGCGKKEEPPPPLAPPAESGMPAPTPAPPPAPTPAAETEKPASTVAMQLAATVKADIDKAMAMAKEGKYTEALGVLQQRLAQVQSDPELKKLLDDAIISIQKMMTEAAAKKGISDLQKTFGK